MAADTPEWKFLGLNMWQQVVLGIILGITAGFSGFEWVAQLQVLGTVFIKLIKMVVPPMIFFALITGITSLTQAHQFRGMAIKGTLSYMLTAFMAVMCGLALGTFFEPGLGVPKPNISAPPMAAPPPDIGDFLMQLIPHNIINALAGDFYIQIVIFAIFIFIAI